MKIICDNRSLIIILVMFIFYHMVRSPNISDLEKFTEIEECKNTLKEDFNFTGSIESDRLINVQEKVQKTVNSFRELVKKYKTFINDNKNIVEPLEKFCEIQDDL